MSIKDIQLNGSNLCNVECMDKNKTLHPETCVTQVLTGHDGNTTLSDWLSYNEADPTQPLDGFGDYNGLVPWLKDNYPINAETITLPIATTSTLGAIKVGQYLYVDNTGILSVDKTSLGIPEIPDIDISTTSDAGIVKLGSNTLIPIALNGSDYQTNSGGKTFPLKLDSNSRAGIFIPNAYHKVKWNEIEDASNYVKNNTLTINYGGQAYEFISNGSTDTNIDISSVSYTAGEGIDIDNGSIKQIVATSYSLGGIKVGYTKNGDKKPVQIVTDSTSDDYLKAFVDIESVSYTAGEGIDIDDNVISIAKNTTQLWQSNALSTHYFRIPKSWITSGDLADSASAYVPLFKILNVNNSDFRVGQYFEIISRLTYVYYGKYSLVYGNASYDNQDLYSKNLLTISNISIDRKKESSDPSLSLDIVAYYKQETIEGHQYGVITVYRKYNNIIVYSEDTFNVCILGQNNPNCFTPQNDYIYYCTNSFEDNETIITDSDVIYTNQPSTRLGTLITNVPIVNNP